MELGGPDTPPDKADVAAELVPAVDGVGWLELVMPLAATEEAPAELDPRDAESAEAGLLVEPVVDVAPLLEEATAEDARKDEEPAVEDVAVDDEPGPVPDDEEAVEASAGMQVWAGPQV